MTDESYSEALAIVPLALITAVVSSYSIFIGNIFYAIEKTKYIFISMIISCAVNLSLSYWLIDILGLNGANLSILISFVVSILIRDRILARQIGFKTNIVQVLLVISLFSITMYIFYEFGYIVNLIWLLSFLSVSFLSFRKQILDILSSIIRRKTK